MTSPEASVGPLVVDQVLNAWTGRGVNSGSYNDWKTLSLTGRPAQGERGYPLSASSDNEHPETEEIDT